MSTMTKVAHQALVDRLRALTKTAENDSESKLKTEHPSGSDSADSDQTQEVPVGPRYEEQTEENLKMYPKGTASATKNEEGAEEADPGNNRGVKVRASGEIPEVDRNYALGEHHDPGTSHPSGNAKTSAVADARKVATEIGGLAAELKKLAGDSYLEGGEEGEPAPPEGHDENQKGTSKFPEGDTSQVSASKGEASDGSDSKKESKKKTPEEQGSEEAEKLAKLRKDIGSDARALIVSVKQGAEFDAGVFTEFMGQLVNKLSPQKPSQKVAEDEESEPGEKKEEPKSEDSGSEESSSESPDEKPEGNGGGEGGGEAPPAEGGVPPALGGEAPPAEGGGAPPNAVLSEMAGLAEAPPEAGGVPPGLGLGGGGGAPPELGLGGGGGGMPPELAGLLGGGGGGGMGGGGIPPELAGLLGGGGGGMPPEMGGGMGGGGMPPEMGGGGMPPEMGGEAGGGLGGGMPQLTPEEEALLLQALLQQGMDPSSIGDYAKMGAHIKSGKTLSQARKGYYEDLCTRVKAAQEIVRNTIDASSLTSELSVISKGV